MKSAQDTKDLLKNRLDKTRTKKELGSYIKYGTMGIEEVLCKKCHVPIRKLVPDDRFSEVREINGKKVMVERLVLSTLSNYCEIRIFFDDGSKHETFLCTTCAKTLSTEDLEWIYCTDLQQWLGEKADFSPSFWESQLKRTPVSFEILKIA